MGSTEEVAISIYVDGMEINTMKVTHLRAVLEKKSCLPVNGKTRKGTFTRESVAG